MTHRGAMENTPDPAERDAGREQQAQPDAATELDLEGRAATGGMPGMEYEVPPQLDAGTGRDAGPGTGWGITSGNPTGFGQTGQPETGSPVGGADSRVDDLPSGDAPAGEPGRH
jgi:hypothetical protein